MAVFILPSKCSFHDVDVQLREIWLLCMVGFFNVSLTLCKVRNSCQMSNKKYYELQMREKKKRKWRRGFFFQKKIKIFILEEMYTNMLIDNR